MSKADALRLTRLAAVAADDKMGEKIVALDVSKESTLSDYFVFITGTSHVHIRALEDAIREALRHSGGSLTRTDGQRGHLWRVLDYGGLIVHIMDAKTREFYSIEKLWERGRPVQWSPTAPAKAAKPVRKGAKKPSKPSKRARPQAKSSRKLARKKTSRR